MIKQISKLDHAVERPGNIAAAGTDESIPNEEILNPEELLSDLKMREAALNKLINEGHKTKDIEDLKLTVSKTIIELEEILNDPELDILSDEVIR